MRPRKLTEYEGKRSFERTPEPRGDKKPKRAKGNRFVIHEHHARRLHWDLRLEHEGALASWALPKGVPQDPKQNRLAVRTEDHPLEYLEFQGEIPKGEYGAGTIAIWDRGTHETEKFRDDEVIVTFAGDRVRGRYALFQTDGDNWMIHRMDPPADPEREPMPHHLKPMLATLSTRLPHDEDAWAYELKWDGVRAIAYCEVGHLRLESRNLREITSHYPELRPLAAVLGAREAVLDGEVVAFDEDGRPSFERLQSRINLASEAAIRRKMADVPVTYLIFDLLYLDGRSLVEKRYTERRERLEALELEGSGWQTPRHHRGEGTALPRVPCAPPSTRGCGPTRTLRRSCSNARSRHPPRSRGTERGAARLRLRREWVGEGLGQGGLRGAGDDRARGRHRGESGGARAARRSPGHPVPLPGDHPHRAALRRARPWAHRDRGRVLARPAAR